jgi:lipopolysaccharide transport system permease protein
MTTSSITRVLRPRPYVGASRELLGLIVTRRPLIVEMAKRQVATEHSGKTFGRFWGIFQPLFLFAVYAFIYGVVFKAKIGGTTELPRNFTVYFLSGLVPWLSFLFLMARGPTLVTSNVQLVKQVVFELPLLPIAACLAGLLSLVLGLGFIGAYTLYEYHSLPWTYLALPFLVLLQFFAMLGAAFTLAAVGVFFRDIGDFVQVAGVVLIFLMPIVYLPSAVPAAFDPILWLNPFSYMVWCYQDLLYYGAFRHHGAWWVFPLWTAILFAGGYRLFRRLRPHFADVL